ncbi:MAG: GNAT family N-acetyltransferase [Niabella sp.]|nr:GNAT family N-acetyltransferase [Niabella sp.]
MTIKDNSIQLRKASTADADSIWSILQQAIEKRKVEGSAQWQDGYPNPTVVNRDIEKGYGYVCEDEQGDITAYVALIFDIEPAYEALEGKWLTDGSYAVIHRLAVSQERNIKGLATKIMIAVEDICLQQGVPSIKVDTNFDNTAMLRILEKLGYTYCGEVFFRGAARKAYEKILNT